MLDFLIPNPPKHEVVVVETDDEKVCHRFEIQKISPDLVYLRVEERFMDCELVTNYTLKLDEYVLKVVSCYMTGDTLEKVLLNAGYHYIRLPRTNDAQEFWEYMPDMQRKVKCVSKIDTDAQTSLRILHVSRVIEDLCLEEKGGFLVEEFYAEGIGLIKRIETIF